MSLKESLLFWDENTCFQEFSILFEGLVQNYCNSFTNIKELLFYLKNSEEYEKQVSSGQVSGERIFQLISADLDIRCSQPWLNRDFLLLKFIMSLYLLLYHHSMWECIKCT